MVVWNSLDSDDRTGLNDFVSDAWLRRNRRRRATVVARVCAAGVERVNEWMWSNRIWGTLSRIYNGPL
jgi:hypothetical protein